MITEQLAAANRAGVKMTRDEAFEEVVCDAAQRMLTDTDAGKKLAAWGMKSDSNKITVKRIWEKLTELFNKLRAYFKDAAVDSKAAKAFTKLDANVQKILGDMLVDMSTDAAEKLGTIKAAGMLDKINTTGDGGVRYSISKTSKMPYVNQLELIEKGKMNGSNSLYIGKPLDKLQSAGFSDAPLAMNQGDYRKARRESAKNKNYSSHAVPYDFFKKMPHHIGNAPMLIDNGTKVSVVTPYGMKDTKGNDSFVIAGVWRNQQMESDVVNLVKSAYPLDDFNDRIKRAAEEGKLVVVNKNKAEEMLATIGIQPAEVSCILNLAKSSLSQPETDVKQISTTDSDGNQLTVGQQEYFADSQERDADGNLRVMYRGDSEEVTVFDRKKSKASNLYGRGFYYTSEKSHAGQYGIVRAFYLNTVNPLMPNQHKITKDQMLRLLEAVENDGEDYDLYNYGQNATAKSVLDSIWGKGDFEMLQDISATAIGDLVAAVELFNEINGTTYDSVRLPTETVIFNSNQAKLTTNKNPTDNPDIRYKVSANPEGYDTTNLHWAIENDIISTEDQAAFWEAIADISKRRYRSFARTKDGGYIIETPNVMMFTDADFKAPTLSKVIVFPYGEYVDTEDARTAIRNEVRNYGRSYQSVEFFESLHGPGFVTEYNAQNYSAYAGQISRGKGKNGSRVDSQSGSRGIRHGGEGGLHSGSEVDNKLAVREDTSAPALLRKVDASAATPMQQEKLAAYREQLKKIDTQKEILRSQNERLKDAKGHTKAIILNNIRKTKNRIQILEDQLARMENNKALQTLVEKERAAAEVRYQESIEQVLQEMREQYGTIPEGEKAVRDDSLPVSMDGRSKVSRSARTVKGAAVTMIFVVRWAVRLRFPKIPPAIWKPGGRKCPHCIRMYLTLKPRNRICPGNWATLLAVCAMKTVLLWNMRTVVKELNSMLMADDKKRHVPDTCRHKKDLHISVEVCVRVTYLPGQSPAKYCRRT